MTKIAFAMVFFASIGLFGASRISLAHWTNGASCPILVFLPVCYLILLGYGLILLSPFLPIKYKSIIFLLGWLPTLLFALIGIGGELTSTLQCPHTESGLPKCFVSAVIALIIGTLKWAEKREHTRAR